MTMNMLKKSFVSLVTLPVNDVLLSMEWYQNVLGFTLKDNSSNQARLSLQDGPDLLLVKGEALLLPFVPINVNTFDVRLD